MATSIEDYNRSISTGVACTLAKIAQVRGELDRAERLLTSEPVTTDDCDIAIACLGRASQACDAPKYQHIPGIRSDILARDAKLKSGGGA